MNKLEDLAPIIAVNGIEYDLQVYTTAWGKRCVSYRNIIDNRDYLCSVTVEPDKEPVSIEFAKGFNSKIGNAKTLDDAIDMIREYLFSLCFPL